MHFKISVTIEDLFLEEISFSQVVEVDKCKVARHKRQCNEIEKKIAIINIKNKIKRVYMTYT